MKYDTIVTDSIAKQISEQLRDAIMRGSFHVDERLPTEEELAKRFEVSRPTIREALKRLAAQHLIRSRRGPAGGTFVNRPSAEQVRSALTSATSLLVSLGEFKLADIAEARRQLEGLCCTLAVQRRNDEQLQSLAREISLQRTELSDEEFCASDVRFHRTLVDSAGNPVLSFVMFAVIEALQPITNMVVFRFRDRTQVVDQHQRIHDALMVQDEESAVAALDEQMETLVNQCAMAQERRTQAGL